jgi:hypothetical protein
LSTPGCLSEIIKTLLGPDVARLAADRGAESAKGCRVQVSQGRYSDTVTVVVAKTSSRIKTKTVYPKPRCTPVAELPACGAGPLRGL